jgi:hypothetical protein
VSKRHILGDRPNCFFDLFADGCRVESKTQQDFRGDTLPQPDEAQQEVFGADKTMVEAISLLARDHQHLLGARREII